MRPMPTSFNIINHLFTRQKLMLPGLIQYTTFFITGLAYAIVSKISHIISRRAKRSWFLTKLVPNAKCMRYEAQSRTSVTRTEDFMMRIRISMVRVNIFVMRLEISMARAKDVVTRLRIFVVRAKDFMTRLRIFVVGTSVSGQCYMV